jgi:hypothetical protein
VISRLRDGFVTSDPGFTSYSTMYIDRLSILGAQRGAVKGTDANQAPDTPTGLRTTFTQNQNIGVTANPVSNATGYRFWRKSNGSWARIGENTSPAWYEIGLTPCTTYEYRVTAYRKPTPSSPELDVSESIASAPLQAKTTGCP